MPRLMARIRRFPRFVLPCLFLLPAGAAGLPNEWTSIGPPNVSLLSIAIPSGAILAGGGVRFCQTCTDKGLFRSTDGGLSWSIVFPASVAAIAVDPSRLSTVYAGPADHNLWKSSDGGLTWRPTSLFGPAVKVLRVASGAVWAGADEGLFRSLDGGDHWTKVLDKPFLRGIAISPSSPSVVYACAEGPGAFKSVDGGETWVPLPGLIGTPAGRVEIQVESIAVDPTSPNKVYAAARPYFVGLLAPPLVFQLYRSTDGGSSWAAVGLSSEGPLLVAPTSPPTVYAPGFAGIYRSVDDGASWIPLTAGLSSPIVSDLAVDPSSPTTVYAATGEGAFRLESDPLLLSVVAGRFQVRVTWRISPSGPSALAKAFPLTDNAGAFWFFGANNLEVVVKVVDGRDANAHFWVFVGSLSDLEYDVLVTDMATGRAWTHHNDRGRLGSVADALAF